MQNANRPKITPPPTRIIIIEYALYLSALLLGGFAAWHIHYWIHPDEHFQIYEMAAMKWGDTPTHFLPWEYGARVRPALQIAIVYVLHVICTPLHLDDPFVFKFVVGVLTTFATVFTLRALNRVLAPSIPRNFYLPMVAVGVWLSGIHTFIFRFSSEVASGLLLAWAIIYFLCARQKEPNSKAYARLLIVSACFMGLSFCTRYQIGVSVGAFFLWLLIIEKIKWRIFLKMASASLITYFIFGLLIDRWFYGEWTWAVYNYVYHNIFLGVAARFGTAGPLYYIESLIDTENVFGVLIVICVIYYMIRRPRYWLSWIFASFILIHEVIGHKELRFLIPLIYFLPFIITSVWVDWLHWIARAYAYLTKSWKHGKLQLTSYYLMGALVLVVWSATQLPKDIKRVSQVSILNNMRYRYVFSYYEPIYATTEKNTPINIYATEKDASPFWYYDNKHKRAHGIYTGYYIHQHRPFDFITFHTDSLPTLMDSTWQDIQKARDTLPANTQYLLILSRTHARTLDSLRNTKILPAAEHFTRLADTKPTWADTSYPHFVFYRLMP